MLAIADAIDRRGGDGAQRKANWEFSDRIRALAGPAEPVVDREAIRAIAEAFMRRPLTDRLALAEQLGVAGALEAIAPQAVMIYDSPLKTALTQEPLLDPWPDLRVSHLSLRRYHLPASVSMIQLGTDPPSGEIGAAIVERVAWYEIAPAGWLDAPDRPPGEFGEFWGLVDRGLSLALDHAIIAGGELRLEALLRQPEIRRWPASLLPSWTPPALLPESLSFSLICNPFDLPSPPGWDARCYALGIEIPAWDRNVWGADMADPAGPAWEFGPVIPAPACPPGVAIIGPLGYANEVITVGEIHRRSNGQMGDFFVRAQEAHLAEMRCAHWISRPEAFSILEQPPAKRRRRWWRSG